MALERLSADFRRLSEQELERWRAVPSAIASDAMNRGGCMAAVIKPLKAGLKILGQARTVQVPAADNAAIHIALSLARPGEVLVVDGMGHVDTSIWGGILNTIAVGRGLAGVVLDGATRDCAEIAESGFPLFCRGAVPRGGRKGDYGTIDGTVCVAGVTVRSGDLVIGDDDGVTVVPLHVVDHAFEEVGKVHEREKALLAKLAQGMTSAEALGIAVPPIRT